MVVTLEKPPVKKTSISLWKHQRPVYVAVNKALYRRERALVVAPPGFGKTVVAGFVSRDFFKKPKDIRILYLAHENELLVQAELRFKEIIGDIVAYDRFYGEHPAPYWNSKRQGILFSSFQTMLSGHIPAYMEYDPDHFDLLIVDEGHHAAAKEWRSVIEYFSCPRFSITAVKEREDGKDITEIFGHPVADISITDGIVEGWLAGIEYYSMSDGLDKKKLKELCDRVIQKKERVRLEDLNKSLFIERRTETQAEIINEVARLKEKAMDLKTMIFCKNIKHTNQVYKCFKEGTAGIIHSNLSNKKNADTIRQFREGEIQYLLSVDKMNEGIDIPDVQAIAFLRDTDSYRIFIQQLGRGLRKLYWKTVVRVIDFVGNIDRLMMINKFANEVREKSKKIHKRKREPRRSSNDIIISGEGFDFNFDAELVDVMKVLRAVKKGFYPTWQESAIVVASLGITSVKQYQEKYKEDVRLPSNPQLYSNFPGWNVFLGKEIKSHYKTWQEASEAAIVLKIHSVKTYLKIYMQDKLLPSSPDVVYKDFPGWEIFLGKRKSKRYETWQEASVAAIRMGIFSSVDYQKKFKNDERLPFNPMSFYSDFPGWDIFLGREVKNYYGTWQEAAEVAKKLGIKNYFELSRTKYLLDKRMPRYPDRQYADYPGHVVFFNTRDKKEYYKTWQEAAEKAIVLGIRNGSDYFRRYKEDPKLPGTPPTVYKDFPGWNIFFGKKEKNLYLTWQEAAESAALLGIKTPQHYMERYKEDPRLPASPYSVYKDFPGMTIFLGKQKREELYCKWDEASAAVISLRIKSQTEYNQRYKEDPRLPASPYSVYKDFPGWPKFLGKTK